MNYGPDKSPYMGSMSFRLARNIYHSSYERRVHYGLVLSGNEPCYFVEASYTSPWEMQVLCMIGDVELSSRTNELRTREKPGRKGVGIRAMVQTPEREMGAAGTLTGLLVPTTVRIVIINLVV